MLRANRNRPQPEEKLKLDQFQSVIKDFLIALAPTRYQFTETTLTVKLDLAQHLDVSAGLGVSAGISGVAINATVSIGYGTDYRGAAECRNCVARGAGGSTTLRTLLDRAKELGGKDAALPETQQSGQRPYRTGRQHLRAVVGANRRPAPR